MSHKRGENLRLFLTIELPPELRQALASLRADLPKIVWSEADNLHLTLRSLGRLPASMLPALLSALGKVEADSFELRVHGLKLFSRSYQSILWARLEAQPGLMALKVKVDQALEALGYPQPKGPYRPHITLGKQPGRPKHQMREFMKAHKKDELGQFAVSSFSLYQSGLQAAGPAYSRLETFPLAAK